MSIEFPLDKHHFDGGGQVTLGEDDLTSILNEIAKRGGLTEGELGEVRVQHIPVIVASDVHEQPGLGPEAVAFGALMLQKFTLNTDVVHKGFKIPTDMVGPATFHLHWSKTADDDESGKAVRWRLTYSAYDGKTQDAANGSSVIEIEDTYDDASNDSKRIVHRTSDYLADGTIQAGYYVSVKLEAVTPNGTPLVNEPGLGMLDLLYLGTINKGEEDWRTIVT